MDYHQFNPTHQYGDYIVLRGHGIHDDDPLMIAAEVLFQDQRRLLIPEKYLKTTEFEKIRDELWMADSDEAGEHKGSLWPHKLKWVSMIPVTIVGWKTIPKKVEEVRKAVDA